MHTPRRVRPLWAALALAALVLGPGPAAASPFTDWLGALLETLDLPTIGFVRDPDGGNSSGGNGTPAEEPDAADAGFVRDPNG
ncbi:MAG TPA: hypothetical protein DD490_12610 [Acidobacteria bacterium]|nr:hypothetical protein [Acidobacteriota bacterium]